VLIQKMLPERFRQLAGESVQVVDNPSATFPPVIPE
jgi:hypothetical protein